MRAGTNWRRRIVTTSLGLAVFGAIGLAAGSWWAADYLTSPDHRAPGARPEGSGLVCEDVTLRTADGLDLAAWVVLPKEGARGTVLVFHGIQGRRRADRLEFLVRSGFRGIAVDLRAHGESDGTRVSFGWNERHDVEATVAYARERWPGEPLAAWGESLGAAAIVYAAQSTAELDAVVLESLYDDIGSAYANRIRLHLPRMLWPFAWAPRLMLEWRFDLDGDLLRPVDYVPRFDPWRLLLARGAEDRRVGLEEFESLCAAAPGAESIVLPHCTHHNLMGCAGSAYGEPLVAFLESRLAAR
jgi:pimeloyl-ACP methyl ester carboxylesterase